MSAELIARYRAEASHHARLACKFATAFVLDGADVMEELRYHNRQKERLRQQADALEASPAAWVIPASLAWQY